MSSGHYTASVPHTASPVNGQCAAHEGRPRSLCRRRPEGVAHCAPSGSEAEEMSQNAPTRWTPAGLWHPRSPPDCLRPSPRPQAGLWPRQPSAACLRCALRDTRMDPAGLADREAPAAPGLKADPQLHMIDGTPSGRPRG